jgi:hypothetical protein
MAVIIPVESERRVHYRESQVGKAREGKREPRKKKNGNRNGGEGEYMRGGESGSGVQNPRESRIENTAIDWGNRKKKEKAGEGATLICFYLDPGKV